MFVFLNESQHYGCYLEIKSTSEQAPLLALPTEKVKSEIIVFPCKFLYLLSIHPFTLSVLDLALGKHAHPRFLCIIDASLRKIALVDIDPNFFLIWVWYYTKILI